MLQTETVERRLLELLKKLMASTSDIVAMKLTAVSQSGNRLKDFVDIAYLSSVMTLNDMLDAFEKKYPRTDKLSAVRGLTYFNDIDFSIEVKLMKGTFDWGKIEDRLYQMVQTPEKLFPVL